MIKQLFANYFELLFWVSALIALAVTNPGLQTHFSLCPFKLLGISWCPGCGLGHAISFLLHGNLAHSFKAHWLGIPVFLAIVHRISMLAMYRFSPGAKFGAFNSRHSSSIS